MCHSFTAQGVAQSLWKLQSLTVIVRIWSILAIEADNSESTGPIITALDAETGIIKWQNNESTIQHGRAVTLYLPPGAPGDCYLLH